MRKKKKAKTRNHRLINLNKNLRRIAKNKASPFWGAVREKLMTVRRKKITVNVAKINRYTLEGDTVVVPGKVLSLGSLSHTVVVAAYDFSDAAIEKIKNLGGEAISIEELAERNPEGKGLKIIA